MLGAPEPDAGTYRCRLNSPDGIPYKGEAGKQQGIGYRPMSAVYSLFLIECWTGGRASYQIIGKYNGLYGEESITKVTQARDDVAGMC